MYKHLVRILLIFSLFVFIIGQNFPGLSGLFFRSVRAQTENGIGGGLVLEDIHLSEGFDLGIDLDDVLALEEHFLPKLLTFNSYTIERGDMIGVIAVSAGLNEDTLISVNDIRNSRLIQIGQVLRIPNQDGIFYSVQPDDTLENIANRHNTTTFHISAVNELFSENLRAGERLFIPGGRMDWVTRQEINGDLFIWPSSGRITSPYGWRRDPFGSGARQFHTGIDISGSTGIPVRAAMHGRVSHVGYDSLYGNFVLVNHHSGYRTLYAHMNTVRVRPGAQVATGERIGEVGSTGLSTGPHLHFTVFKDGVTVNPRSLMR